MDLKTLKRALTYRVDDIQWRLSPDHRSISHLRKRRIIALHASDRGLTRFVETGTYLGDMTASMSRRFDEVHSVELGDDLYRQAVERFRSCKNVRLYHGDSADVLTRIVPQLSGPTLFWLDAHYSGGVTARAAADTPIEAELRTVFADQRFQHTVLIDDARLFAGTNSYPTLAALQESVATLAPRHRMLVAEDVIRITPAA